jgi:hypothetical protein
MSQIDGGEEKESSPPIQEVFQRGQNVYVKGAQYVDDWSYIAYAVSFKDIWTEGDPFGQIFAQATVTSDITGDILSQLLWGNVQRLGEYNIIIDYNADTRFSWTLDGLGSFEVVPEPATVLLGFLGLSSVGWRLRKRLDSESSSDAALS